MTRIHVYHVPMQPATNYLDHHVPGRAPMRFRQPGNRLRWCFNCRKRRPAKNLLVQVSYDNVKFWCKPGKGCKK